MTAQPSVRRSLGSIALGFEIVVVFLGMLVVFGLHVVPPAAAFLGGGAVLVLMIVAIALLRYRWGFLLGWLVQFIVIAGGFLVGMLFIVGGLFTALWAYCMITGARIERRNLAAASSTPTETENNP